jgi:hypothetical protein
MTGSPFVYVIGSPFKYVIGSLYLYNSVLDLHLRLNFFFSPVIVSFCLDNYVSNLCLCVDFWFIQMIGPLTCL